MELSLMKVKDIGAWNYFFIYTQLFQILCLSFGGHLEFKWKAIDLLNFYQPLLIFSRPTVFLEYFVGAESEDVFHLLLFCQVAVILFFVILVIIFNISFYHWREK
jgi:hypothetical protein